jgi:hypothetical protein
MIPLISQSIQLFAAENRGNFGSRRGARGVKWPKTGRAESPVFIGVLR